VRKCIAWYRLSSFALLYSNHSQGQAGQDTIDLLPSYLGVEEEGTAAASAAAFAKPWRASMGAFKVARGSVSSDSSSEDGVVLGTIPYVAYLCGCEELSNQN
jgi:hypothetical protein